MILSFWQLIDLREGFTLGGEDGNEAPIIQPL